MPFSREKSKEHTRLSEYTTYCECGKKTVVAYNDYYRQFRPVDPSWIYTEEAGWHCCEGHVNHSKKNTH